MAIRNRIQYQQFTQAPPGAFLNIAQYVSWLQPFSEPNPKNKIKQHRVALIASGNVFVGFAPFPEAVTESKWHYPWSEPVRQKLGVRPGNQQFISFFPNPIVSFGWNYGYQERPRFKPDLHASRQLAFTIDTNWIPSGATLLEGWYNWYSEPVRYKSGLEAWLQQFLAYHPRILPTPQVTAIMAATETNNDIFLAAINVYSSVAPTTSGAGAKVSIVEISGSGGDPVSIRES